MQATPCERTMDSTLMDVSQRVAPFVDGALSDSHSDVVITGVNPSNGKPLLNIPAGCDGDVDRAVASARRAFDDGRWSETPPSFRKDVLHRFADLIIAEAAVLDAFDAGEMGKPIQEPFCNAVAAGRFTRFFAEAVDKSTGDVFSSDKNSLAVQRRVPRGVVAAVTPWNFPTFCAVLKLAPALAAGNSVVLKPSEMSSRSALRLAQLAVDAGIPPGVLNVVPGVGETVGRRLGLHMDVDMMTFTGSTAIGKLMMQYAGQSNMKVVMAECGGKSPHIVFDDGIDLDQVSQAIAARLLTNQGQICSVGSRLLVQTSIEEALVEKIAAKVSKISVGSALDPKTTFGPLASAGQCTRVLNYIETAQSEGAQLAAGGTRLRKDAGGYFVAPTLFRNVSPGSRIAQEEVFGPVLAAMTFKDAADAVRIANGTIYGLAAYVWTTNLSTGMRMAKSIRSSVRINATLPLGEGAGWALSSEPFGQSGVGAEGGLAGMQSYMRRQSVTFSHE
jgi:acyl-CoA reductase-like NAD-dependent aldehyde dehydrogenase